MFNKEVEIRLDYFDTKPPSFTCRMLAVHGHRQQTSGTFTRVWIFIAIPIMWILFIFSAMENTIEAIMTLPFILIASIIVVLSCFSLWGKFLKFALRKNLVGGTSAADAMHNRRVAAGMVPAFERIDQEAKKRSKVILVRQAPRKGQGSFGNIFTSVLVFGFIFTLAGIAPMIYSIVQHGWTGFYQVYIDNPIFIVLILFLFIGILFISTVFYNAIWAMKIKKRTNELFAESKR